MFTFAGSAAAAGVPAPDWPRPAPVRELVTDARRFHAFSSQVSADVESALAATPAPTGDRLARLLTLRVHLALYLGADARALAAATRIRETLTPPAERPFSGLLTEAFVVARSAAPGGAASPEYAPALRAAVDARLATLPSTPELAVVLERQRDRFRELSREALFAEAEKLGARLDRVERWSLDDTDAVIRVGHRLSSLLPVRDPILAAFETALRHHRPRER